jgi:succinate dehydrogenase / fumarate reductase membrane anchor subunit
MSRQASGLKAWMMQRLSAVYLGFFGSYLLLRLLLAPPADHAALVAWVAAGPVALGLLMFFGLLLAHAWVGMRDVLIDYARPPALRLGLLSLIALLLFGCGLWALQAVLLARTLALTPEMAG